MSQTRAAIQNLWGESIESSIWKETQSICDEKKEWDNIENPICKHIYQ